MTKYPTLMIDHPVEAGVGVRAGVARYPLLVDLHLHLHPTPAPYPPFHLPPPAAHAHAHVHVHNNDLAPAHGQGLEDGMNLIHGSIQTMKPSSGPKKNRIRRGWRFVVDWPKSAAILSLSKSQCDHGVKITKSYYLLHHLRLYGWMKIPSIMLPRLPL